MGLESIFIYLIILIVAAIVSGFLAGLFGIGGGIIMVPVLFALLERQDYSIDISYKVATATSLAVIIFTGTRSALQHQRHDAVHATLVMQWMPFLIIGAFLGAIFNRFLPVSFLLFVFIAVISFAALNLLQTKHRIIAEKVPSHMLSSFGFGTFIGCASTWIGIGGGTLTTPILTAYNEPIHRAIGTAAAIGVIIAMAATIGNFISGFGIIGRPPFSIGYVNLPAFACLALIGNWFVVFGVRTAHFFNPLILKRAFALFLIGNAVRMALKLLS